MDVHSIMNLLDKVKVEYNIMTYILVKLINWYRMNHMSTRGGGISGVVFCQEADQ